MNFFDMMKEVNDFTYTENGAGAYCSTGNAVLDAFGSLGGMMHSSAEDILSTFYRAFNEDRKLSMRMLFYFRDVRGGQGMRRLFRIILRSLAKNYPDYVNNNLDNILFYGRGDDYLVLFDTPCEKSMIKYVKDTLSEDIHMANANYPCSLLAKWLPSENTSSNETRQFAIKMRNGLHITSKQYRKMLSFLRNHIDVVERKMSANEWDEIDFTKLPSKASMIYSDAFYNHVKQNYIQYLKNLATGEAKINAATLFPVDIIHKVMSTSYKHTEKDVIIQSALWDALPNYLEGKEETGICVVDTSGSMSGQPIEVAISLGMYCADKCVGPYKGKFITFSANPELQEVKGKDIYAKVSNLQRAHWDMNTNLEAVFDLILNTAIKNKCKQKDVPAKLYIISDMQFDSAVYDRYNKHSNIGMTFMDSMRKKYADNGYILPAIVYWNVRASKCGMFQKRFGDTDCCMVSGYSASLFKAVIEGTEYEEIITEFGRTEIKQKIDPMTVMLKTLNNERYDKVWGG
jgi:hypothetical protein